MFILIIVILLYLMSKNKEQGKGYFGNTTDTCVLIAGLMLALLAFNKDKQKTKPQPQSQPIIQYIEVPVPTPAPAPEPEPEHLDKATEYEDPYNPYPWMGSPTYSSAYRPPPPFKAIGSRGAYKCNINDYPTYDEQHARLAALRQRDKKAIDGWVTKNANYYKKNFGRELDDAEKQQWWGNDEY